MSRMLPDIFDVIRMPDEVPSTPEARLQRLEDKEAIRDVLSAYCYFEDQRRWHDMVALFTADCTREIAGTLDQAVHGREALLQACLATEPIKRAGGDFGEAVAHQQLAETEIRHVVTTELIRVQPDRAKAWLVAYYQIVATRGEGGAFRRGSHEGTYHIEFAPDAASNRWLIRRQVIWTNHATNPLFRAEH
ncbi:MAG: nuclear transport factor 2 family protein [Chloroflexi bacterium]|nr:nuclear transport factor 2 family protein [Chloroflexota bacterium]